MVLCNFLSLWNDYFSNSAAKVRKIIDLCKRLDKKRYKLNDFFCYENKYKLMKECVGLGVGVGACDENVC
jgi:hypothetical protein